MLEERGFLVFRVEEKDNLFIIILFGLFFFYYLNLFFVRLRFLYFKLGGCVCRVIGMFFSGFGIFLFTFI